FGMHARRRRVSQSEPVSRRSIGPPKQQTPPKRGCRRAADDYYLRRRAATRPARPKPTRAKVPGSGTDPGTDPIDRSWKPLKVFSILPPKVMICVGASAMKVPIANCPIPPIAPPLVLELRETVFPAVAVVMWVLNPLETFFHHSNSYCLPITRLLIVSVIGVVEFPDVSTHTGIPMKHPASVPSMARYAADRLLNGGRREPTSLLPPKAFAIDRLKFPEVTLFPVAPNSRAV